MATTRTQERTPCGLHAFSIAKLYSTSLEAFPLLWPLPAEPCLEAALLAIPLPGGSSQSSYPPVGLTPWLLLAAPPCLAKGADPAVAVTTSRPQAPSSPQFEAAPRFFCLLVSLFVFCFQGFRSCPPSPRTSCFQLVLFPSSALDNH